MTSCPACAKKVDPLRAGHVAIFDEELRYFCDLVCREAWLRGVRAASPAAAVRADSSPSPAAPVAAVPEAEPEAGEPIDASAEEPAPVEGSSAPAPELETDRGPALVALGMSFGVLAVALALAGASRPIEAVRIALAVVGFGGLVVRAVTTERDPSDVHPIALLAPGLAAIAVALATFAAGDAAHEEAATFAGLVVGGTASALHLVERSRRATRQERAQIKAALACSARRIVRGQPIFVDAAEVKPGEEVTVEAGETVPVDATVVAGVAMVHPWLGTGAAVRRIEGDAIVAGARVVSGALRAVATYAGSDRAFARLSCDPKRRADVHAPIAKLARRIALQGGLAAMALAALAAFANGEPAAQIAMTAIAGYAAIATAGVGSIAAVHVARGILEGLRRGVAYRSARDWDRAASVAIAAFCARGTLLLGEPELADLEVVGALDEARVLALVAGAEGQTNHPVGLAVQRAALSRGIRPDAVRSPNVSIGMGITAVASTGEPLVVGSRALLLKEKISVAVAEQKIGEIEAHGRTVLLVALGGRLVGVLGMQDGLRPGARAAVQHLLDAQVEPVLLSGDTRETCEAIGRALDIEHIRPEVLPQDRALEIERLAEGGITVAVLGHPRGDEATLGAATVAVALAAAGGTPGDWAVALASDDVRDGALSISLAHRTRAEARTGLILSLSPGIVGALAVSFGLVPAAYAPLAAVLGAAAATLHARANDLPRAPSRVAAELALP